MLKNSKSQVITNTWWIQISSKKKWVRGENSCKITFFPETYSLETFWCSTLYLLPFTQRLMISLLVVCVPDVFPFGKIEKQHYIIQVVEFWQFWLLSLEPYRAFIWLITNFDTFMQKITKSVYVCDMILT